jgi:hypothetical protein
MLDKSFAVSGPGSLNLRGRRLFLMTLLGILGWPSVAAAAPVIGSISFAGASSNPQMTILGSGFGSEPASTNLAYKGYTGFDYGNALYFCDTSTNPNAFCAGQNDGKGGGDTIGLVVGSYTDTQIVYALGSSYSLSYYPSNTFRLQQGDHFTAYVSGMTCSGVVDFGGTPTLCSAPPIVLEFPPVSTSPPSIAGKAQLNQTLTETHGTWSGSPTSFSYQWEDCSGPLPACTAIPGATSQTYTLISSDAGHTIRVTENARNAAGTGAAVSSKLTNIVSLPPPPPPCGTGAAHAARRTAIPIISLSKPGSSMMARIGRTQLREPLAQGSRTRGSHRRLTLHQAIAKTARGSRRFAISIALTSGVESYFGESCHRILTGTGYVNFRQRAARWSVSLPRTLGGVVHVIASHDATFVNAPALSPPSRHTRWIALRTARDYSQFNRVPFLRDLVVLTNPMRSLDLLASAKPSHRRARAAARFRRSALTASGPSVSGPCAQAESVASGESANPQRLTSDFTLNVADEAGTIKSWAKNNISAKDTNTGVCETKMSVENITHDGFDVVIDFTNPVPQVNVSTPAGSNTYSYSATVTYHYKVPCYNGRWEGTSTGATLLGALPTRTVGGTTTISNFLGGGKVNLDIDSFGNAKLTTREELTGEVTAPVTIIDSEGPSIFNRVVDETYPSIIIREIPSATGHATLTPGDGLLVDVGGPTHATLDVPGFSPKIGTKPHTYSLTGTCASAQLVLNSDVLGAVTLTKTGLGVPIPMLTGTEWQQQIETQSQ